MKSDLYTKVVLTVIAVCLLVIAGKEIHIIPNAQAYNDEAIKVNIVKVNGNNVYNAVPVEIKK